MKVIHITTLPQTAASFLHGQLAWLRQQGLHVTIVSSPGAQLEEFAHREGIHSASLPMQRAISPLADLQSIGRMARLFRRLQPDLVHAHTPKAGFVGMAAARAAGVGIRIYHLHGLRFETSSGFRRTVLRRADQFTCRNANRVFCVSRSLQAKAIQEGLVDPQNSRVLADGSINGLDVDQFAGTVDRDALRHETRQRLGIPSEARCVGFVGRLVRDKGVVDLEAAWQHLRVQFPDLRLLLVGPFEDQDAVPAETRRRLEQDPRVHLTGLDWNTRPYFAAMDVFTLPSYREGLPYVLLEAGAMQLPSVSCEVTGCVDVVDNNVTGTLVPPANACALHAALTQYLNHPELRAVHGRQAAARIRERYRPQRIWQAVYDNYLQLAHRAQGQPTGTAAYRPT